MKLFKRTLPVFLVFQDDCIRYVKLTSKSPLVVDKLGEKILPQGVIHEGKILDRTTLSKMIHQCVDEWKLKGKKVRFTVPDAITFIRKIPVPSAIPEKELEGYIGVEIGASIHVPFDEPVFDTHKLEQHEETTDYLLFAAPENVMKEYMSVLEEAKLKPIDAELSSLAIYRLYHHIGMVEDTKRYLLLNVERNGISGTAFDKHSPVFTRFISLHPPQDHQGTKHDYFDYEERWTEITTEIGRIMNFYQFSLSEGVEFDAFLISGDHPSFEKFQNQVEEAFNINVIEIPKGSVKLFRGLDVPTKFYAPVGLGLKGE
ncbi:type IV pilus biogenesis protein PilM [Pseudalkalibacillus sp. SCS-8]|uniref:type IV pilus biogenesis protein PilM n=1 Tax=Pseudalkalibacillus nanhaiensis TaxID=3115291 RepID=UPI0032DB5D1D